ncbi:hypothetical protein HPB48_012610 [Haemaphysalis longicornis]|uniref:Uncharacterized protein n=1 Tax=Haemaphysalis longicornis TaxID=44386 RepID=A0A9J6G285_HAELO|nr:hypothetical protein HPB48_012610 [Haemaphysalis longicornis]
MLQGDDSKLAVMSLFTGASNGALCVKYLPAFKVLPGDKTEATARPLANMVAQDGCQPLRGINLTDSVVLINDSGHCSLEKVSRNYYNVGAYGLLVGLSDDVLDDATYRRESSDPIDIVVMFSSKTRAIDLVNLLAHLEPTTSLTFAKEYELDAAVALIWFVAVFCVGAGGYWAGSESHHLVSPQALPCFFVPVEVRQLLLIVISVAVSFSFVVFRNESWSWILQDILGTLFSVYMIRNIRMPSLKVISLLLVLLFFYDIFFVFLTPLILPKGDSVMVEVATGGGTGESVPMVMRVPRSTTADMAACMGGYLLLGLGDILIPAYKSSYTVNSLRHRPTPMLVFVDCAAYPQCDERRLQQLREEPKEVTSDCQTAMFIIER